MVQMRYRIPLKAPFTMLHEQQARTTIDPADGTVPGIAYCHNVMPTENGMTSIGYLHKIDSFFVDPDPAEVFADVREIFGHNRGRHYIAWALDGTVYQLRHNSSNSFWYLLVFQPPAGVSFKIDDITIGVVNGVSYINYTGSATYIFNENVGSFNEVVFTGLSAGDFNGLTGSNGYLIVYNDDAIRWSSTIDPTDFVPSQVTGSGGGDVADISGDILFTVPNSLGILMYTEGNIVAGTYTGNALYPFRFKKVEGSKGGLTQDHVAYHSGGSMQYAYTKAGLQAVKITKADSILPMATDFLSGRRIEDYNEATKEYEITDLTTEQTLKKKVKYIASRYLVISYGVSEFTHAIILDTTLNRIGKLKYTHVDVFEYLYRQTEIAKESIALISADGRVQVVDFSVTAANSSGVLICGKLELSQSRFISLQEVEVENVQEGDTLEVLSQVSLDGKNFTTVAGYLNVANPNLRTYEFREEGKNHSIVLIGKFNATDIQVTYVQSSRR